MVIPFNGFMFLVGIWINPWCFGMSINQKFGPWHEWGASWSYELLILNPRFGMIQSDVFFGVESWNHQPNRPKKHGWCAWLHLFPCVWRVVHGAALGLPMSSPWRVVFHTSQVCELTQDWRSFIDQSKGSLTIRVPWQQQKGRTKCWNRVTNPPN